VLRALKCHRVRSAKENKLQRGLLDPIKIDQRTEADLVANERTIQKKSVLGFIASFFCEPDWPINLAVFRIVLFSTVLCSEDFYDSIWFASIGSELRVPPQTPLGILGLMPISASLDETASALLLVACIGAIIGFKTRICALLVVMLGFYVMGIPNCFHKVNHTSHHLIWFAIVLAFSRCADTLSVDAMIRSKRKENSQTNENSSTTLPAIPSMVYGLPLRITWVLIGLLYFFPGFWKVKTSGLAWAFSDNLANIVHKKILDSDQGWMPLFRIDRYPDLYHLAGLGTLIFELSFIALIFFPVGRIFLVLVGQLFHSLIMASLGITFFCLQTCYVALVDWHAVGQGLKKLAKGFSRARHDVKPQENLARQQNDESTSQWLKLSSPIVPLSIAGILLIYSTCAFGICKKTDGWPFACYPLLTVWHQTGAFSILSKHMMQTESASAFKIRTHDLRSGGMRCAISSVVGGTKKRNNDV